MPHRNDLPAGNATVASMINLGVITLLRHPDQLDKVLSDASLWPSAVAAAAAAATATPACSVSLRSP
jgi:nitric oxide reductase